MHHTRSSYFQPACVFTETAPFVFATAAHVYFDAWFSERKVASSYSDFAFFTIHLVREFTHHADQVSEPDVFTYCQTLNLVKLVFRAWRDLLVSIAFPRQYHSNRFRKIFPHSPDLSGRSVGTQDNFIIYPEGVPHVSWRVILRNIQKLEIKLIAFHFWSLINLESHFPEYLVYAPQCLCCKVQMSGCARTSREWYIKIINFQMLIKFAFPQILLSRLK